LIWLLVLALPAQGAAAATMAFCNPAHHADVSATASHQIAMADPDLTRQHHADPHAVAGDLASHTHRHAVPQGVADSDPVVSGVHSAAGSDLVGSAGDLSATKLAHADHHKCSACASCCSAAVIGSTVLKVPAPGVAPTVFISVVPTVEKFASDGPDRPPRVHLV
jgi:hypothetical protein